MGGWNLEYDQCEPALALVPLPSGVTLKETIFSPGDVKFGLEEHETVSRIFIMFNSNPTKFRVFSFYSCWVLYFFLGVFYTVPILESFGNILQTFETTKLEKDPLGLFIDFYYLWFWVLEDFQNQGTSGFQSLKFVYTDIQFRVF